MLLRCFCLLRQDGASFGAAAHLTAPIESWTKESETNMITPAASQSCGSCLYECCIMTDLIYSVLQNPQQCGPEISMKPPDALSEFCT